MKFGALVLCLLGFVISGDAVFAQALNADGEMDQSMHRGQQGRRERYDHPQVLLLHEREDGQQRNALHYAVGKGQPGCTPGL